MRKFAVSVLAIILVFTFSALLAAYVANNGYADSFYNSDVVHVFMVTKEVAAEFSNFATWNHSPAFYFFPDWLFAYFISGVVWANWAQPISYGAVLIALYSFLLSFIAQAIAPQRRYWPLTFAALSLFVLASLIAIHTLSSRGSWLTALIFVVYWHTGSVLFVLLCLGSLLRWWSSPRPVWLVIIAISCVLATFSDALFLVWFAAPALIVLAIDAVMRQSLTKWRAMAAIGLPTAAASLIESAINSGRMNYMQNDATVWQSTKVFGQSLVDIARSLDPLITFYLLAAVACFVAAVVWLYRGFDRRGLPAKGAFALFAGGSIAAMFLAPIATKQFLHEDHWRYFVLLPNAALMAFLCTLAALPRIARTLPALSAFVLLATSFVMAAGFAAKPFAPKAYYPLPACLLDAGLRVGLADYWDVKRLMFLSEDKIVMVQIGQDAREYNFNYNMRWHEQAESLGGPTFIVLSNLDPRTISAKFGQPARVIECGGKTVWDYERALQY